MTALRSCIQETSTCSGVTGPRCENRWLYWSLELKGTKLHEHDPHCPTANDPVNLRIIFCFSVSWERVVFTPLGTNVY